jgi:hypothetical protein
MKPDSLLDIDLPQSWSASLRHHQSILPLDILTYIILLIANSTMTRTPRSSLSTTGQRQITHRLRWRRKRLAKVRIPLHQHRGPFLPLRLALLFIRPLLVLNLRQTLGDIF